MDQRTGINVTDWLLSNEEECQFKGYVTNRLGYTRKRGPAYMRRGTIAHAFIEAALTGVDIGETSEHPNAVKIIYDQHERRGWELLDETLADADHAHYGARLALEHVECIGDLYTDERGVFVERKIDVPIAEVLRFHRIDGRAAEILAYHCKAGKAKIDAVMETASGVEVADWKFSIYPVDPSKMKKQPADSAAMLPHPQGSWFWAMLAIYGIEARYMARVRVHCERPERPLAPEDIPRNKDGLPSRAHKFTTVANYMEALGRPLECLPIGTKSKPIQAAYRAHVDAMRLAEQRRANDERSKVNIDGARVVPHLAIEMNRSRLLMFARHLDGVIAHRSLRVYNSSPCIKRWGCEVQEVCHAAISMPVERAIETVMHQQKPEYVNMYNEEKST